MNGASRATQRYRRPYSTDFPERRTLSRGLAGTQPMSMSFALLVLLWLWFALLTNLLGCIRSHRQQLLIWFSIRNTYREYFISTESAEEKSFSERGMLRICICRTCFFCIVQSIKQIYLHFCDYYTYYYVPMSFCVIYIIFKCRTWNRTLDVILNMYIVRRELDHSFLTEINVLDNLRFSLCMSNGSKCTDLVLRSFLSCSRNKLHCIRCTYTMYILF